MPRNPILSTGRDAQNMGVNVPGRAAEPHKSYHQSMNYFDLSYKQAATLRYADVHPFFILEGLPADQIPLESYHSIRSYTLQAPLESDLYLHKSMTMVPMKAILPRVWDRFIVNPTKGDDVPDDVYCSWDLFAPLHKMIFTSPAEPESFLKEVIIAESLFSRGSLLANLKIDFSSIWLKQHGMTFDDWFDTNIVPFVQDSDIIVSRELGDGQTVSVSLRATNTTHVGIHTIFECLRDGCDFQFVSPSLPVLESLRTSFINTIRAISLQAYDFTVDISRAVAYQLSCIQCLTDDSIDNIYTSQLYLSLFNDFFPPKFFEYNGELILYDQLSKHSFDHFMEDIDFAADIQSVYELYSILFQYRRSLKFGDYFIDARPEPYSVGEMSAEVRDGMVSAVDQTMSILKQRFLNWSNRVGNKLYDYIKGLTGVNTSAPNDEPKYIIHEVFQVKGFEVENTGSEQRSDLSVTTLLKSAQSKYMYNIELTDYCILLGLVHFDMERFYISCVDRLARKKNRFDFFNKFFQYSGDQDIKRSELNSAYNNGLEPIAYTTRHMEYKKSINHATGGFATKALPGWVNTSDFNDSSQSSFVNSSNYGINSEFIRNHSEDFDKFYSSLSGCSLGNYFHFQLKFHTIVNSSRQMAVAPDIL